MRQAIISTCLMLGILVAVCGNITQLATADDLDTSALKPGDRVEFDRLGEWKSAKVLEVRDNGWLRVELADFPASLVAPARMFRLPVDGQVADDDSEVEADAGNPFLTDSEKRDDKHMMRTWSDASGRFKVEAKFVRIQGDQVVLRRKDNKEIKVPLARLSSPDQSFLEISEKDPAENQPKAPLVNITPTQLDRAQPLDLAPGGPWNYEPELAAGTATTLSPIRVPLGNTRDIFDKPVRVMLVPGKDQACVTFEHRAPGKNLQARLIVCDLKQGRIQEVVNFPEYQIPMAVSPVGDRLLACSAGLESGQNDTLTTYHFEGKLGEPLTSWQPYGQEQSGERDIQWSRFIGDEHVLTLSRRGVLVLWKLAGLTPIWSVADLRATHPGFSANLHVMALPVEEGIVLLETLTGKRLGHIPVEIPWGRQSLVAMSKAGTQLALFAQNRCQTWNLENQELIRDFSVSSHVRGEQLAWVDDEYLLVQNRYLIDVTRRVWAWDYDRVSQASKTLGGNLWYVAKGQARDSYVLGSASLPDSAARDSTAGLDPEELLIVQPGMTVSIDLSLPDVDEDDLQEIVDSLQANLEKSGFKVDEGSSLKLVGSIRTGEKREITYRSFGSFGSTDYKATEEILELSFQLDDQEVWKYTNVTSPPYFLRLGRDETIKKALKRVMKQRPDKFTHIVLPHTIARAPLHKPYGTSPLPVGQ